MTHDAQQALPDDPRVPTLLTDAALFDDVALEHLSNKGLVRRARKLLDEHHELESTDDTLDVVAAGWRVRFDWAAPLSKATCGCPTAGICQHVVAAIIALRQANPAPPPVASGTDEPESGSSQAGDRIARGLLALSDEELMAWAKTVETRWALQRLASIDPTQIIVTQDGSLNVELPAPHATVRFMDTSLDAAIVKPSTQHDRRSVVLALLALWLDHGRELVRDEAALPQRTELPRERKAVVRRASKVCRDLLAIGLLHLGDAERERLDSLAASARGVKLYRLALLAERAADQAQALAALSIDADTGRLLDQLAEISVVAETIHAHLASDRPLPDGLCGTARARYEPVGQLQIVGLGHYQWGDHRFAGSTAVFATPASQFFTVARPRIVNGRELPEALGWTGVGSLSSLTGKHLTLSDAKASSERRLSASASTTASSGERVTADDLAQISWQGARPTAPSRLLGQSGPGWTVLAVESQESPPRFDSIKQQFEWELTAAATSVAVTLPFRPASALAIANLERIASAGVPEYVVGRLRADGPSLSVWPISVLTEGTLRNLANPAAGSNLTAGSAQPPPQAAAATIDHLDHLTARLVRVADGGRRPTTSADLAALATTARDWGYPVLQQIIAGTPDLGVSVLRSAWTLQLLQDVDSGSSTPSG